MTKKEDKIRTFFAIDIPKEHREWIDNNVIEVLRPLPVKVNWVTPENIHITLRFIGEISPKDLEKVLDNIHKCKLKLNKFQFSFSELGYFGRQFPRVLWIGVEGDIDKIITLHNLVEDACCDAGLKPDNKKFSPHITIGRVKSPKQTGKLIAEMEKIEIPKAWISANEITLYKSTLTPNGPIYTVLEKIRLV
ncbi:RNA 2',3'-cyclic phosphodiesterase [bacterium]|nr:MAG: RNA 2',3'-cyclic phosphodiesterase [bacterium]